MVGLKCNIFFFYLQIIFRTLLYTKLLKVCIYGIGRSKSNFHINEIEQDIVWDYGAHL